MPRRRYDDEPRPRPPTLAQLATVELDLTAWCNTCHRHSDLRTADLIERLGPDFIAKDADRLLKCSRCGSRNAETRVYNPKDAARTLLGQLNSERSLSVREPKHLLELQDVQRTWDDRGFS
jgi:hypothetical protein